MNDVPVMDREAIEAVLPHRGAMCLIESVQHWDASGIRCLSTGHHDPAHPLRDADGLGMANVVEIAAQAMALHGAIGALRTQHPADGGDARLPQGMLASIRGLTLADGRLDQAGSPLQVEADLVSGDLRQAMYTLRVADGTRVLASGRATVLLAPAR